MRVEFTDYCVEFSNESGGFPSKVIQYLRNGRTAEVIHTGKPWLQIRLKDGRVAVPCLKENAGPRIFREEDGTAHVQYNNVGFQADGAFLFDWRISFDYELMPDGNCFIGMNYEAFEQHKPPLEAFTLRIPMDFGTEDDVTYECWARPKFVDPTGIKCVGEFIRNLQEKKEWNYDIIVPLFGFDFGRPGRPSRHIEWFVEDQLSLDETPDHVHTRLTWENGSPVLEYEFATCGAQPVPYPYYWRNKIGFTLGQTPKIREKAPLRLFHYLDQFENFPTVAQVRKMAAEGADVLNVHECWRTDARNNGYPAEREKFHAMIEECRRNDIRVCPYIRGDEESAKENACDWFHYYLSKDYDGLYSDYGSPWGFFEINPEYAGGHVGFKSYYKHFRRIRRHTIGKDGFLTIHTGPFFCSSVLTGIADGYVSGEGEKGIMLHSRRENAFFSQTTTAIPALWTAAFPAYRTEKILPFMANIGQFPFVTLGEQWKSCACAGSKEPGNVTFARPLWRLYGLMKNECQIRFDNDLCDETIICDSYDTGLSRFTMQDGSRLYLLSNFSSGEHLCSTNIHLHAKDDEKIIKLNVGYDSCTYESVVEGARLERILPANGICGYLIYPNTEKWAERLELFVRAYPARDTADLAYEKTVEEARRNRFECEKTKELYLKVDVPFYPGTIEPLFWNDCYDSSYRLYATGEGGRRRLLGYISKKGFTTEEPAVEYSLWPTDQTDWIPLHSLLGIGKYFIELQAYFQGSPSYMHCHALLSETCDADTARDLQYYGELDEDRSRLSFSVELI